MLASHRRSRRRRLRVAAVAATASLAMVLAACSSSGSDNGSAQDADSGQSATDTSSGSDGSTDNQSSTDQTSDSSDDGSSDEGSSQGESDYPTKKITFTVQAAAGGGSDTASRAIASVLEDELGQSIVVENRPGASGSVAVKYVSQQPADGYHIGFCPVECAYFDVAGYDVSYKDVDLLGQIMNDVGTIAVPADSPYKDLADLVDAAKDGKVTVGNAGAGSVWEVMAGSLAEEAGVEFTPVPFDGAAPAVTAAMGGKVDAVSAGEAETRTGVESGKLRVLAIFSEEPSEFFPDIPTAKSQGYDLEFGGWGGIYGPKGMPDNVKQTLEDAIEKAVNDPAFSDPMNNAGITTIYKDSADFTAYAESQHDAFASILGE